MCVVQTVVRGGSKPLICAKPKRADSRDPVVVSHCWPTVHPLPKQTERVDHLAAALAYASAGVHVFPLAPRSKVPLISAANGGHGLHDATTDLDVIRAWWRVNPRANIGLRTGSNT